MAKEARAEYQRAQIDPRPIQTGSTELPRIKNWFRSRVGFYPQVYFAGDAEIALEGGRVGYVEGIKVANFLYRKEGKPLVLVVFKAEGNPAWSALPARKWVVSSDAAPLACVWRLGDYVYALVGEAPPERMQELARAMTPPDEEY